ncbi:hypothetical protein L226DRAFT_575000 [Lentinus tigrinus ALCF2SS1-7]|uniref:Alpha/beta hydrolase fold-3 domain-containing protein n=1 Tax=Lentinus tigrinus ALCF2SS1-6 TaxID=1328759 RepID=A0A5C2RU88_9APHY|nr:hypothetical protein L227DRAFT_310552 [Lentinus tigrinus ALCF2SS1-6]RPD70085.1 hypothetical protein L226DRAFT_575000 [Lentinus tigrinus ALCF2SS1-7]
MNYDPAIAAAISANPAFTELFPPPPPGVSELVHARKVAAGLFAPFAEYYAKKLPEPSQYVTFDKRIPVDGGEINATYVRPAGGPEDTYPVLVWFHAGGWMLGGLESDDIHLRTVSVELKLAVLNVDYRHSPEYTFPIPFEDSYTAVKWVVEHAVELKVDLKKGFLVGGDSAGGNMSAAIALKARDDPFFSGRPLTGQYLREPATVHPDAVPDKYKDELRSFSEFTDTPVLNTKTMNSFLTTYAPQPSDTRISPLLAASHAGLPPAFVQVQEFDPLRDEGKLYEKFLRQAGVPTKLIQYPGCFHAFHYCLPAIPPAVKLDRDAREGLKWLLAQKNES